MVRFLGEAYQETGFGVYGATFSISIRNAFSRDKRSGGRFSFRQSV